MTDSDQPGRSGPPGRVRPNGRLALGLLLIGTGRPAGFAQFGATGEAYLASLAPWLAMLIVLAGLLAWTGRPLMAVTFFLVAVCNLLAPAVIADAFCRLWRFPERWAHYANVLNCAQWLVPAAIVASLPLASLAVAGGLPTDVAVRLLVAALAVYILWFHWFAARHALRLSAGRAVLVMLGVVFGTALLLQIPALLTGGSSIDRLEHATPA